MDRGGGRALSQRLRFDPTHIHLFFCTTNPKNLVRKGSAGTGGCGGCGCFVRKGPQARVDGVDVVDVVLGVKYIMTSAADAKVWLWTGTVAVRCFLSFLKVTSAADVKWVRDTSM
jgi:hypothetical protein